MSIPASSLSTLLRLIAPGEVIWLVGNETEAADTLVNWITLDPDAASGGEVYLLQAADLTPVGVDAAQKRGVVAIVALGKASYPARFRDARIPIASLPTKDDLHATHRNLLTILVNRGAYLMEQGNEIHARLTQLSAEGAGLQGMVSAMAEISGQGVLMQDKRMDILATSVPPELESDWEAVHAQVRDRESLPEVLRDRKVAGKQSELLNQNLEGGLARLVTSINVGGMARGYLSIVGKAGELNALTRVVAEQGAVVCAVEMSRSKAVRETEKRLRSDLLTALLKGELSPRDARLWTERIGLDLDRSHACLRFCWDSPDPPSPRRLETLLNSEVTRQKRTVIVSMLEDEVICFCQVSRGEARPEQAITLGRSVLDRAILNCPDAQPRCGIGTPAKSLENWRDSYRSTGWRSVTIFPRMPNGR
ncbi:MAG: PucR family transcriptional regulator [Anaerolineales bacterium]